ncbi:alpha/beta hydrolase [Phenylobacterium sp.]|jgi:pimeloyl-ACP methyl ester carboxylesterase|uniref:alpha/beta hydrolase n=1 Tax=Phenylobacterium sp. TaxID=1871053 RepID=UPI002F40E69B
MSRPAFPLSLALAGLLAALPASAQVAHEHHLPGAPAPHWRPALLVREQAAASGAWSQPVLYVHGATFPSANSMMARFGGESWADALNAHGHDVFALDFAGYGGSERYPAMRATVPAGPPVGRSAEAERQIARAVALIRRRTGAAHVSIIAHSWGTIPAARFAIDHPRAVDRLVLFGPILRRDGLPSPAPQAWSLVTIAEQHARFVKDVPAGHAPVLEEAGFPAWAAIYLASDPESRTHSPPAVKVPNGPSADVADAHAGALAYDPARLDRPVLLIRGAWDSSSTAADAAWFMAALPPGLERRLVTVPEATHLMHLETGRHVLYQATEDFLSAPAAAGASAKGR